MLLGKLVQEGNKMVVVVVVTLMPAAEPCPRRRSQRVAHLF